MVEARRNKSRDTAPWRFVFRQKRRIFAMCATTSNVEFPDGHLFERIRNREITNVRVTSFC